MAPAFTYDHKCFARKNSFVREHDGITGTQNLKLTATANKRKGEFL